MILGEQGIFSALSCRGAIFPLRNEGALSVFSDTTWGGIIGKAGAYAEHELVAWPVFFE